MPVVDHKLLRSFAASVFEAVGTPAEIAAFVADSLGDANLAGHDSHGVLRLPGYCGSLAAGDIIPTARCILVKRDWATAIIDGALGWGQPAIHLAAGVMIVLAVLSINFVGDGPRDALDPRSAHRQSAIGQPLPIRRFALALLNMEREPPCRAIGRELRSIPPAPTTF